MSRPLETFFDVRQALKLSVSHYENPDTCYCRSVLEEEKDYFPYPLPGNVFLERRPYTRDCDYERCLHRARVHKIVNINYMIDSASISDTIKNSHPKIAQVIRKQVRVFLCLRHFEENYQECCTKCATKWQQEKEVKEREAKN